jgi:hypothetical protein
MDIGSSFVLDTIEGQKQNRRYFEKTMNAYDDEMHNRSPQPTPERRRG